MNDRIFINNSAIGLYPLMVVDRDVQRKRLGRRKLAAMIVASVRTLVRFGHQRLTLTVNDRKAQVDTPLLFVGNNDYRIDLRRPGQRDSLEDGRLCVLVMRKKTRRGFIAASVRALLNRSRADDMVRLDDAQRLRVSSRRMIAVSLDGEVVRVETPLDYKYSPQGAAGNRASGGTQEPVAGFALRQIACSPSPSAEAKLDVSFRHIPYEQRCSGVFGGLPSSGSSAQAGCADRIGSHDELAPASYLVAAERIRSEGEQQAKEAEGQRQDESLPGRWSLRNCGGLGLDGGPAAAARPTARSCSDEHQ